MAGAQVAAAYSRTQAGWAWQMLAAVARSAAAAWIWFTPVSQIHAGERLLDGVDCIQELGYALGQRGELGLAGGETRTADFAGVRCDLVDLSDHGH